jgi:hypothetical protein
VAFYDVDRIIAPDIEAAAGMVLDGALAAACRDLLPELEG